MSTTLLIEVAVAGCAVVAVLVVMAMVLRRRRQTRRCGGCGRIMRPEWSSCLFCGWLDISAGARLEFLCGPLQGQKFALGAEVTTIGSDAGNTIVLEDPGVSRKHVGIRRSGSDLVLADLGSTNGIYVNGERVPQKKLASGDILRVGSTEIVFHE